VCATCHFAYGGHRRHAPTLVWLCVVTWPRGFGVFGLNTITIYGFRPPNQEDLGVTHVFIGEPAFR
jgi:hypothetical protein